MKTLYSMLKQSLFVSALSILFVSFTIIAKGQATASHSTGTPGWTTAGTIASTAGASFTWTNTTIAGQFQKANSTTVVSPILQYPDGLPHTSVSIAYDLQATSAASTVSSWTITIIWGPGGANQVSATGSSFNISSGGGGTRHNFTISGINLPGSATAFEVKLSLTMGASEKDVNSSNFKSDASLAGSGTVLAVQLNSFSASRTNSNVNISWITNYESSNAGFEVQRRLANQTDFQTVAFVNSKAVNGNSTTALSYNYTDVNASTAVSYYRIKQINLNGIAKYSEIRQVDGSKSKAKTLVYPNPSANGITNIIFTTAAARNIQVIDMNGQVVKSWSDYNSQELKIVSLKPGIYSVSINNTMTSEKEAVRLVVTR